MTDRRRHNSARRPSRIVRVKRFYEAAKSFVDKIDFLLADQECVMSKWTCPGTLFSLLLG